MRGLHGTSPRVQGALAACGALTVADGLSLWASSAGTPGWTVPAVLLGAGFALAAGCGLQRVPETNAALVLLVAAALLLGAPLAALVCGRPVGDAAVTAGTVLVSSGLLLVVPVAKARRAQQAVQVSVAVLGGAAVAAASAGAEQVAVSCLLGVLAALFTGGWVHFEATGGAARRQLLWLVLGVITSVPTASVFLLAADSSDGPATLLVASVLTLPLPLTTGIALHSPDRRDVRPVISRVVLTAVMSTLSVSVFASAVSVLRLVLDRPPGVGVLGILAALLAAAHHPVLVQARNTIDELLFGGRADPLPTLARLGEQLSTAAAPEQWLESLRRSLAVPGLELRHEGLHVASAGSVGDRVETLPLRAGAEAPGELLIGLPPDQLRLPTTTRAVLQLVSGPLGQALESAHLTEQLRRSRSEVVGVLEEERRRMRRDLHDGLGPTLTGVAYSADAAANLLQSDPVEAAALVQQLRGDVGEAISEIRRIVYGLRPRALDELGLVAAVTQQAGRLRARDGRPFRVDVAAAELPELSAAVEVVAYRVAVEAVTNVARHAGVDAARITFRLGDDGVLDVRVADSGPATQPWREGVGITSMRERVEQLGGSLTTSSGVEGGCVRALLPLH